MTYGVFRIEPKDEREVLIFQTYDASEADTHAYELRETRSIRDCVRHVNFEVREI
jgi:hypothetical protein